MNKMKKGFKGGYRFKYFKGRPLEKIEVFEAPDTVTVPLPNGDNAAPEPLVKAGDEVRAGQAIASGPIHSPVDGKVAEISKAPAIVIEKAAGFVLSEESVVRLEGANKNWRELGSEKVEELMYHSGAANLDISGLPTKPGNSPIASNDVEHIVIRVVNDELLAASDAALLSTSGIDSFVDACRILKKAFSQAELTIAISSDQKDLTEQIISHVPSGEGISVKTVSDKYPQGSEEVLVPTVTGRPFPYGYRALNLGIIVLSVQTALSVYSAVTAGMPVVTRVIALGGTGFKENLHIQVPIGTPWDVIVRKYGDTTGEFRFIRNSLLTGQAIEDLSTPVTAGDFAIYAIPEARTSELFPFATPGISKDSYSNTFPTSFLPLRKKLDTNIHGEQRACLSCSFCADVCPVGILPNILHRHVERDVVDEPLRQFGIFKCIDCNLCTYVCPSKIPVAELIRKGKQMLIEDGLSNEDDIKLNFSLKGI